ncbi:MAG TPA: hypothetical protein VKE74_28510, partial [Gemmataceae bacterium]|nr:hypothetical protein [Gemmataceae bacterium]
TYGYHFAPDGKTFRTVYREAGPNVFAVLEVREIETASGKTTKALGRLEVGFTHYVLSADGKRLVTFDTRDTITAYDADSGKELWKRTPKLERPFDGQQGGFGTPIGPGGRDRNEMTTLQLSPDGKRLVVTRGLNPPVVLNAVTGEPLPVPANTALMAPLAQPGCFSPDGRLLALSGQRFTSREVAIQGKGLGGRPAQTVYDSAGSFLAVWEVDTGRQLKAWDRSATVTFLPNAPVLAVFENNGAGGTRLGLWDFSAEAPGKK